MEGASIPDIVVGRLPGYLQALKQLQAAGETKISSKDLGQRLGISAAQIRKDLSQFGEFGKQGTGYSIEFLIKQIQSILKVDRCWDVVIIGAGNLGHAIVRYQGFANRGFCISRVFDNDPEKIGKRIGAFIIEDISTLEEYLNDSKTVIALLTVPAEEAQPMAERLVAAGMRVILN
ncbi:MAG: redox-sensing transcriptional repressor Rex, partial [Anaerolineaceae bacterium]|nr:redox-sensing transcriptional repressor Rex [Anaerolineaceae bacterium]